MKGGYRLHRIDHDFSDYRDLEPPPLRKKKKPFQSCKPNELEMKIEEVERDPTEINVKSRTSLVDMLMKLGPLERREVPTTMKEVKKMQNSLLRQLRRPQTRELKKYDLSPDDYLLFTLKADGYTKTEERIKLFMEMDEKLIEYQGLSPLDLNRQPLRSCKECLKILAETLKQVEHYSNEKMKEQEFTLLLHLARYFESKNWTWTWLSYEIYQLACEAAKNYTEDQGFGEALINYLFGKMLLKTLKKPDEAMSVLRAAHGLSMGKSWTAFSITGDDEEDIHRQTSYLLFQAILEQAEKLSEQTPAQSVALLKKALILAKEINEKLFIQEATLNLGTYFLKTQEPEKAIGRLVRMMGQCDESEDQEAICNCYLLLALCYKSTGDHKKALQYLTELLNFSLSSSREIMFGIANRYLGEHHLYSGNYNEAIYYLDISHGVFVQHDMPEDIDITAVLNGIARSYKHKADYIDALVDDENQKRLDDIINWKNHGTPFWKEDQVISSKVEEGEEKPKNQKQVKRKTKRKDLQPTQFFNKPVLPPIPGLVKSIEDKTKVVFKT